MSFGNTFTLAIGSFCSDARCVYSRTINLAVDSFQKERSRSHEEPREPFYPPVVNHFINLRRIMPRVKRRPEVNVSSAPSLSRGAFLLICFRRLPLQLRTNIVRTKRRDTILSRVNRNQSEINDPQFFKYYANDRFIFSTYA